MSEKKIVWAYLHQAMVYLHHAIMIFGNLVFFIVFCFAYRLDKIILTRHMSAIIVLWFFAVFWIFVFILFIDTFGDPLKNINPYPFVNKKSGSSFYLLLVIIIAFYSLIEIYYRDFCILNYDFFVSLYFVLILFMIFAFFYWERKYQVRDNFILLYKKKVLYPKDKLIIPFIHSLSEIKVINKKISIFVKDVIMINDDDIVDKKMIFQLDISFEVLLDIAECQKRNIQFDVENDDFEAFEPYRCEIKKLISKKISERIKRFDSNGYDFDVSPTFFDIIGLPFYWDGKVHFSNIISRDDLVKS